MERSTAPAWAGRATRRATARRGALAAGAVLAGGIGAQAAAAELTRAAANPTEIVVSFSENGTATPAFLQLIAEAIAPLLAANPGLKVSFLPTQIYGGAAVASMLAGNGPDVFGDWVLTGYTATGLALDLAPYVAQDNVDINRYQAGQIKYVRQAGMLSPTRPIQLCALPQHALPAAMAVNLGILDQLGLKYPEQGWTSEDWAKLWQAATVKSQGGKPGRYGVTLYSDLWVGYDHSYNMPGAWILAGWGGEYVDPTDPARAYLDNPASIASGAWAYDLLWSGVGGQWSNVNFVTGQTASFMLTSDSLQTAATQYRSLKWDLFDLPVWPKAPTTYTSTDSLGIWAGTKNPDAAWTVLKWMSYGSAWQHFQMTTMLYPPSLRDLTTDWIDTVKRVAPPLRDKNLDIWIRQADANQQYVGNLFRYSSNQVQSVISNYSNLLANRKVSVAQGFGAAARQIDSIETVGRQAAVATAAFERHYQSAMSAALAAPSKYQFTTPPRAGAGVAPVTDAAQVAEKAGVWTVTGGGSGVNGVTDGLTFACAPFTGTTGAFTCRLVSIAAVKPNTISDGAKFGLMVRADLSDDTAQLGIEVAAGRGIHVHAQPLAGMSLGDQQSGSGGLLPASAILRDDSKPAKNFLTQPVWLRLVRNVNRWQAYSSLDGSHWTAAGTPLAAELLGGWVGLFVTAHNNGALVQVAFDHVSGFVPSTFVRIGAP